MSDFMDALVDILPEHNSLKESYNPLGIVLDRSLGEWFDNRSIQSFYDNLFINYAHGEWLDLHGQDYGVIRQSEESDDEYLRRIVQEVLEHLTPVYFRELYELVLYTFVEDFDPSENMLTSDNPYINSEGYMCNASDEIEALINAKFVVGEGVTWF